MFAAEGLKNLGESELKDGVMKTGLIAAGQEVSGGFALGVNLR